jgi:hypothetical protein
VHPFALFPADNNTGVTENPHMVGKRGLRYLDFFQQPTGTFLARTQELHNADTVFVTKCFEYQSRSFFINLQEANLP